MKLKNSLRWAVVTLGILGGTTNAYSHCFVTPDSILTEGQTLQLVADCMGDVGDVKGDVKLKSIDWKMSTSEGGDETSLTGVIELNQQIPKKVYYTIPAELTSSGAGEYWFSVAAVDTSLVNVTTTDRAKVVVKSKASAASSAATATGRSAVNGACRNTGGIFVGMPEVTDQCDAGRPSLAITGPTSFTWSCLGLNGGNEDNCYGVRGFKVTAVTGATNGCMNCSISPASRDVTAGDEAIFTAATASGYRAEITGCNGTQSGNTFTIDPVTSTCTVTANFTNAPTAGVCGSQSPSLAQPGQCSVGSFMEVADITGEFKWNCLGTNGGSTTSCAAPIQYTVSAVVSGTGGTITTNTPTSQVVTHNGSTTFSVTPTGTNVASASGSGCSASVSGNTITTGAITAACTVTVSFAEPQTGINANGVTMPGTVKEVATALPITRFGQYIAGPVNGDEVYSFRINVPEGAAAAYIGSLNTTKRVSMVGQKRVTISEYRGDYNPTGKPAGCTGVGVEVVTIRPVVNYPTASTRLYCHLIPGKTYWANVSSRYDKDSATSCSNATNCGFYFEGN